MKRLITSIVLLLAAAQALAQQCIPSGVTDQYTYFVAVDSTDFTTRETGLSSFTVYRSRNGGAAAAFTTPTINETDSTNMPGVYELLLDEDMTLDAGDDVQHVALHITATGMAPVTKEICIARPKVTAGETLTVASGNGQANVTQFGGTNGTFASGRPEVNTTHAAGTAWGSGAITAGSIATDAITAAKIAADAIGSSELAATAVGEIADQVWEEAIGDHSATVGSTAEALSAAGGGGATDQELGIVRQGTAQSATGTTIVLDSGASFADDAVNGMTVLACGSTQGYCQSRTVTDYVGSTDTATVDTWTVTPSGTITFYVFGTAPGSSGSGATAQEVWEYATRTLTALDEDTTTIDLNATAVGSVAGNVTGSVGSVATGGITAASLAADAITAAKVAADVGTEIGTATWATTTRVLPAGTNIVLAKGTGITGFNDLDAAGIRSAVGLASANLDTQLSGLDGKLDTVDTVADAIKAKTDQLTFGVTNTLNVNVEYMNANEVCGTGDSGTPWAGCP